MLPQWKPMNRSVGLYPAAAALFFLNMSAGTVLLMSSRVAGSSVAQVAMYSLSAP